MTKAPSPQNLGKMTLDSNRSVNFLPDSLGQSRTDSVDCGQILSTGMVNPSASPEMPQKCLQALCTESFDRFQGVCQSLATAALAVEVVDESVRFIAREDEYTPSTVQDKVIRADSVNGLLALGEGCEWDSVNQTMFDQETLDFIEVDQATVD